MGDDEIDDDGEEESEEEEIEEPENAASFEQTTATKTGDFSEMKTAKPIPPKQPAKELSEKRLIEAALFISARALSLEELRTLTGIGALGYLQTMLNELKKEYQERGSSVEIGEMNGKYEMRVTNDYMMRVKQFAQDIEISKGALRTLAYIAKHDGVLKSTVVKRIGTQVYQDVHELIEGEFVKAQKAGRSAKLFVTDKFKKYFAAV